MTATDALSAGAWVNGPASWDLPTEPLTIVAPAAEAVTVSV
ncbi:hypothetical protein [Microbacterium sp. Bi128]|nr:hypothetical protein [Microbacterium sp. Bi128]CAH0224536.1 hypothetical protein SRABI128_02282 [Microbacterium sp. Bi128]